jgi:uncharacterized membrane protein
MRYRNGVRADAAAGASAEAGTIMILTIFFGVIIAALITVVADVSTVFLAERELQSVADAAAADAAQQADLAGVYSGRVDRTVVLSEPAARGVVDDFVGAPAHRPHECSAAPAVATTFPQPDTVTVHLTCTVPLPIVNVVSRLWSDGVRIDVVAQAQSDVRPAG